MRYRCTLTLVDLTVFLSEVQLIVASIGSSGHLPEMLGKMLSFERKL
jgi:hypothetical protein